MNKQVSFLVIIIIICMTYAYCSNQTNKLIEGVGGDANKEDEEEKGLATCGTGTTPTTKAKIDSKRSITACNKQNFKKSNCTAIMSQRSSRDKKEYRKLLTIPLSSLPASKHSSSGYKQKHQCKQCMKGSTVGDNQGLYGTASNMSDHYAEDHCDAISAGCGKDSYQYAYLKQSWDSICEKMDSEDDTPALHRGLCTFNSIIPDQLKLAQFLEPAVACHLKIVVEEGRSFFGF